MWINYSLAALSGVLYIAACAPTDQFYLMWIAFIPVFYAIHRMSSQTSPLGTWNLFRLGMVTAFFIAATGFYWIIYATENYGDLPFIAAFFVFLAFCVTNQLQVPLYLLIRQRILALPKRRPLDAGVALILGFAYVGIESLNPKLFSDTAGGAFYNASWIRQFADVGGPFGLSVLVLAVNEMIFKSLITRKVKPLWFPVLILLSLSTYGYYRNAQFESLKNTHASDPVFRTALIQANIGDFVKVAAERGQASAVVQVMNQYQKLSDQALANVPAPDALIWPETAYPAIFERPYNTMEGKLEQIMHGLILKVKGYLVFGGYDSDLRHVDYNSIFFVKANSPDRVAYHKSTLLMFGETLPFAEEFPSLKHLFPTMGFFGRGNGPEVQTLKNSAGLAFQFGPSICYEGLFVDFAADEALLGADALLNVTNDSWFGEKGEPYQHLSLTQFRSIETRIPMIRATNTGFSVWIDPTGRIEESTELSKTGIVYADIPKRYFPMSPYLRMAKYFGSNWFAHLAQLVTGIAIAFVLVSKRKRI